ncbi:hypothetical protein OPW07_24015 [Vibrio europaeus]|uniref:Uncharacterized protein n=1 Tax=Vibrio europaeus TaxID=300876 RepID=A0AAE7ASU3_9VIBR|nr:hypothetical protein [Vibrio europaeus]MDC5812790.1 hypothetical protein [Vibrio europaeus]QJY35967.1 hypothetical protein HOO69_04820 [Vibrio europaeus]QPG37584.1 hypothetical protein IXK98_14850 [Vibrio europaeus]
MTDLDIEFEHIYLEVKAERWPQIERFLFSYYCYREGFVTSKNKPDWESARAKAPRSIQVQDIQESALEPVVPLKVVIGEIKRYWRDGELTPNSLRRILDSLLHYATISKQELTELKKAGLQNAMPACWYQGEEREALTRFGKVKICIEDLT